VTAPPELDVDPYSDEFLADPKVFHDELREAGPVVWLRPRGIYASARHEQVHAILQDWESFTTNRGFGLIDTTVETPYIEVLAEHNGRPVLAREARVWVTTFHPELARDLRLHERFLQEVA